MSFEAVPELLPVDAFWLLVGFNIGVPPIYCGSNQLVSYEHNPPSVGALSHLKFLLNCFSQSSDIHWIDGLRECWRLGPLEFSEFVTLLRLRHGLMFWSLLHVDHSLLHSLKHLSLHDQHLLKCWWWRWVDIIVVVLIGDTVVSVVHLMIIKRFETEIEIKYSQLYASRYNND
jgi:hypothetical protein